MKKLILVVLIFFAIKTDAHKEWVHQYIVNQAYLLLNNTIPNITPMFDSFFRDANGNLYPIGEPSNHSITSVIGGAWTEDHSDIVYGHCGLPFPLPFSGCPLSSTTHFWNPDGDVYANNNLEFASGSFENAKC